MLKYVSKRLRSQVHQVFMYHMRQDLTHVEVQIGANFYLNDSSALTRRLMQVQGDYAVGWTLFVISSLVCPVVSKFRQDRNQILKVRTIPRFFVRL